MLKSVLRISIAEAQKLIEEYAGSGRWQDPNKEIVDFLVVIGSWKHPDAPDGLATTMGTIHYSKKGCHIVPAHPKEGD